MNLSMQGISTVLKRSLQRLLFALPLLCVVPQISHADTTDVILNKLAAVFLEPAIDYLIKERPGTVRSIGRIAKKCLAVFDKNAPMLERELPLIEQDFFDLLPVMRQVLHEAKPDIQKYGGGILRKGIKLADRELDKALEKEGEDPTAPGRNVDIPIDPAKRAKFKITRPPNSPK